MLDDNETRLMAAAVGIAMLHRRDRVAFDGMGNLYFCEARVPAKVYAMLNMEDLAAVLENLEVHLEAVIDGLRST